MPTDIFPAQFEFLDAIREFAADVARQAGMDEKDVYNIQMAIDEASSNIIEHAYDGVTDGEIEVTLDFSPTLFTIVLRDTGKRFDSDEIAEPDLAANLEDRAVGGLGIFFMRKLMDEVRFDWQPEHGNMLTMVKYLAGDKKKES